MPSETPEKKLPTPTSSSEESKTSKSTNLGSALANVGIFILELVVPTALALILIYFLIGFINIWSLDHLLSIILFGVILTALSLGASVFYDSIASTLRLKRITSKKKRAVEYRLRLARLLVGGLLVPIGLVVAANLVLLPGGGTPMTYFIQATLNKPKASPASMIGDTILNAESPATRLQGIKTLQAIRSPEALDQLMRILSDGSALKNASLYEALSQAMASYGLEVKPRLLELFKTSPVEKDTASFNANLFDRYLSQSVETLRQEITTQDLDPQTRQAKIDLLDAAVAEMKNTLGTIESQELSAGHAASLHDFILFTFLGMDLKQDTDLVSFAKSTAANPAYPDGVRGKALLLIAKLGGKGEFEELYKYLTNSSEAIKVKAMEAIANLEVKVSGSAAK